MCKSSFIYGRLISDQRIESWWSQLRRGCTDWWIQHFKELLESGCYCNSNVVHAECLRFCYMDILRDELYRAARLLNNHLSLGVSNLCDSNSEQLLDCTPEFSDLANIIMNEKHWLMPNSPDEAKDLYHALIDDIEKL